nr:putative zinc finger, CCHC-type [Tanacetum cinerariifolium]
MDLESAQNNVVTKLPLLKQENGNSFKPVPRTTTNADGISTSTIPGPVTTEEKAKKRMITTEVDTASIQVSAVSTPVSIVSSFDNTANLSDATVYAFLANQPNGSQLVHEDLEQIHKDDLEEMDLKWQLALLSMRARRYFQKTGKKITINGSDTAGSPRNQESRPRHQDNSRKTVIVEDTSSKAMVAIDGAGFDWSYMADDEVV